MRRLPLIYVALLAALVPLWVGAFTLHLKEVVQGRLALVGVFVSRPEGPSGLPHVTALWPAAEVQRAGLVPGDRLLSLEDADLHGVGPVRFFALTQEELARAQRVSPAPRVRVRYERAGEPGEAALPFVPVVLRWRMTPLAVALFVVGTLVLLRRPGAPIARAFFLAAAAFSFHSTWFFGSSRVATYAWVVVFVVASSVMLPLIIRVARMFPERSPQPPPVLWPWGFALFAPAAVSTVFGTPLAPAPALRLMFAVNVAFIGTVLFVLTRNYRTASAVGRRQLKWLVYGMYVGLVPVLAANVLTALVPRWWWLHDASVLAEALIPVCLFIAIVRFNLFDIDRLIATTALYSILSALLIGGVVAVVPTAAQAASAFVGVEQGTARLVLSGVLACCVIPARQYLRPSVERVFFSERHALTAGVDALLRDLAAGRERPRLLTLVGERLHALLRPSTCIVYARAPEGFVPISTAGFARAAAPPVTLGPGSAALAVIEAAKEPLDLQGRRRTGGRARLGRAELEALAGLGAMVVLPVRRGDTLDAFVTLGEKRSGDVYTATDLALLAAVVAQLSGELIRLDLGRYTSRDVVDVFVRDPGALAPQPRDVTIFFSDIRGSTTIAERLSRDALHQLQNEYFEAMADGIAAHGGLLVKTIGDAAMALWNAVVPAADHGPRGCRAALDALEALDRLNAGWEARGWPRVATGIGIHTGEAMVGNFGTVERIEYDARGDAVNLASRCEGLTKLYGTRIIVSDGTRAMLGDELVCRPLDRVRVKGKSEAVMIHELLGRRSADRDGRLRRLGELFTSVFAAYCGRAWDEALAGLDRIAAEYPGDGPARVYRDRCLALRAEPPGEGWDGIFEAKSK